jgi:hypothetical protein
MIIPPPPQPFNQDVDMYYKREIHISERKIQRISLNCLVIDSNNRSCFKMGHVLFVPSRQLE